MILEYAGKNVVMKIKLFFLHICCCRFFDGQKPKFLYIKLLNPNQKNFDLSGTSPSDIIVPWRHNQGNENQFSKSYTNL